MDLDTGRIDAYDKLKSEGASHLTQLYDEEMAALEKVPEQDRVEELRAMREKALADLRGPLRPS